MKNWKVAEMKQTWPNLKYYPVSGKTDENLICDTQCSCWDTNWTPPECKSDALLLKPTCVAFQNIQGTSTCIWRRSIHPH